ncbi:exonuclease domain-containing protein [Nocardioides sp. STR2]|uniref:Exonuclease domain-containing protein n=1 Tax=Nocardioides pini TaxID=2975053 RepID=A0ABT4C9A5_9ACTN|nr:exonuclease domain-containing protein [Nocardioides pini]MCY4724689.1 exonuclease domain-containing protein [Nocardioides pini]
MRARLPFLRRRRRGPGHYPPGPLRDLAAAPPPPGTTPVAQVGFVALDLETTGLDPRTDHVLALGWVTVAGGEVLLASARDVRVRPPSGVDVGSSATIHGLTDDALAGAAALSDVLPLLLGALHGRVLLAHHAAVEVEFVGAATEVAYGARPPLTVVDTLALEHRLRADVNGEVQGSLRLDAARRAHGLPRYSAHHALTDALAAAELLLAQVAELEERLGREVLLRDLLPRRSR